MPFVEIALSDLEFFERLGGGAAGTVYRGRWKSKDTIVAIKKLLMLDKEVSPLVVGWRSKMKRAAARFAPPCRPRY